jgi:hypothetical protein
MTDLAGTIAQDLASPEKKDLQERLLQAMFLMERYRGVDGGGRVAVSDVADADVSDSAIGRLAEALRRFVRTQPAHPDVGSAIWALGKLRAAQDAPIFDEVIVAGSGYSQCARDQAKCALEDLRR